MVDYWYGRIDSLSHIVCITTLHGRMPTNKHSMIDVKQFWFCEMPANLIFVNQWDKTSMILIIQVQNVCKEKRQVKIQLYDDVLFLQTVWKQILVDLFLWWFNYRVHRTQTQSCSFWVILLKSTWKGKVYGFKCYWVKREIGPFRILSSI